MCQSLDFPDSPGSTSSKEPACQQRKCKRRRVDPWVAKISWRRKWQPTPVFLSGKSPEQRSLVGYSPWSLKESDRTGRQSTHTAKHLIHTEKHNKVSCLQHRIQEDHGGTCVLKVSAIITAPAHTWRVLCNFPRAITF